MPLEETATRWRPKGHVETILTSESSPYAVFLNLK